VSIVILTYNGARFMRGLLTSLLDQTYPSHHREIIVIDNDSKDDTVPFIQSNFPEIECIALPENIGYAAGNNVGYQHAKYDYIIFLNQDTICHRDWLSGLVAPLLEDQEIGACASNIIPVDPQKAADVDRESQGDTLFYCDLSPFGYGRYHEKANVPYKQTLLVSGCAFIIRRETVDELGYLFDRNLWMYAEDTDLSLRLLQRGKKLCIVRDSIVFHLHGATTIHNPGNIKKAYGAIHNRVFVFLKNMRLVEFLLFFPLMVLGGGGKLLELNMPHSQKAMFFVPFSLFSFAAMMIAFATHFTRLLKRKRQTGQHHHENKNLLAILLKRFYE
jgi:GT2 family glycosyltransferase